MASFNDIQLYEITQADFDEYKNSDICSNFLLQNVCVQIGDKYYIAKDVIDSSPLTALKSRTVKTIGEL